MQNFTEYNAVILFGSCLKLNKISLQNGLRKRIKLVYERLIKGFVKLA